MQPKASVHDDNFGALLTRLKDWGIEHNTLVIFLTDNGGTVGVKVYNAGMRGGKVTPYRKQFGGGPDEALLKPVDPDPANREGTRQPGRTGAAPKKQK